MKWIVTSPYFYFEVNGRVQQLVCLFNHSGEFITLTAGLKRKLLEFSSTLPVPHLLYTQNIFALLNINILKPSYNTGSTHSPSIAMPIKDVETPYPVIDKDPHFFRVVRYFRPSDYAAWAVGTAAAPALMLGFGKSRGEFRVDVA
jgi:hypothetical protein